MYICAYTYNYRYQCKYEHEFGSTFKEQINMTGNDNVNVKADVYVHRCKCVYIYMLYEKKFAYMLYVHMLCVQCIYTRVWRPDHYSTIRGPTSNLNIALLSGIVHGSSYRASIAIRAICTRLLQMRSENTEYIYIYI